jgi:quercetin dioxygenase-like cupin family protein
MQDEMPRLKEKIFSGNASQLMVEGAPGVRLLTFASRERGAIGFSTGLSLFAPGAYLPYHFHRCSEAVTVLEGQARMMIEGRNYCLRPGDCVHLPAEVAHLVSNADSEQDLVAHTAFGSDAPTREPVAQDFPRVDRNSSDPAKTDPETIVRSKNCPLYELSPGAFFHDLFARRFGAVGICGGYGRFLPGSSLPCHIHDYDESITIVKGTAACLVQGRRYELRGYDTAVIPKGTPHRFLNFSQEEMAMLWVYAGDEPDRQIVDGDYCSGTLAWPAARGS